MDNKPIGYNVYRMRYQFEYKKPEWLWRFIRRLPFIPIRFYGEWKETYDLIDQVKY